jgi:transglutaminase-like putative cysteine protease/tetratricopeptide (TPR) repeat protein
MPPFIRLLAVLCSICLLGLPAQAGKAETFIPKGPFTTPAAQLLQKVSVDRPENLDVEVLFEEHRFNFDPHGLVTHTIHRIYRTLTQDGVSSWGGIEASYAAWFQETPKMRARVITPEGFEHWLDPKTLVEVGSGSSSNAMYSDVRTVKGPLPSLRPGSVVEEWSEIKDRVPYFAAGSSYRHWLYVSTFTQTHRVVLSAPNGLPLRYVLRGGAKPPTVTTQGNRRTWTFTEHNGLPLRQFPPATSPEIAVVPMIEFSTGRSWEEVSRAYAKVVANQIAGFDAKSLSDTLVLPEDNVASKAAKLLTYLNDNIRYTGLELGQRSLVPATPSEVLGRRYGDCKDKSSLLVALLHAANVPAHVALLETGEGIDLAPTLPGLGLFDHAIVFVPGAAPLWIDPASGYSEVGVLPTMDQDRQALLISENGGKLLRTPASRAADNHIVERVNIRFEDDAAAHVTETTQGWGSHALELRMNFDAPPGQLRSNLKSYAKQRYGAQVDKVDARLKDSPPLLAIGMNNAESFKTYDDGAYARITPNQLFSDLPSLLFEEKKSEKEEEEQQALRDGRTREADKFPVYVRRPARREIEYKLVIPTGFVWAATPPEELSGSVHGLKLQRGADRISDRELVIRYTVELDTRVIQQKQIEDYQKAIKNFDETAEVEVRFFHAAQLAAEEGRLADSVRMHQEQIAKANGSALPGSRYVQELMQLGFGAEAKRFAAELLKQHPKDGRANAQWGWSRIFDDIGREGRPGSDYLSAQKGYREAARLDPKEDAYRQKLATLLRYNSSGIPFWDSKTLNEAKQVLLTLRDQLGGSSYDEDITRNHLWLGEHAGLMQFVRSLGERNSNEEVMWLAATAQKDGVLAAERLAVTLSGGDDPSQHLNRLASLLMLLRRYKLALEVVNRPAMARDSLNQPENRRELEILAAQPAPGIRESCRNKLPAPAQTILDLRVRTALGNIDVNGLVEQLKAKTSPGYFAEDALRSYLDTNLPDSDTKVTVHYNLDRLACVFNWQVDESDGVARVKLFRPSGSEEIATFYLRKAGTTFQFTFMNKDGSGFSQHALRALDAGQPQLAKTWLGWAHDAFKTWGGRKDSYTTWDAFKEAWTAKGLPADEDTPRLRLAAAALDSFWPQNTAQVRVLRDVQKVFDKPKSTLRLAARVSLAAAVTRHTPKEALPLFVSLRTEHPNDKNIWRLHLRALDEAGLHDQLTQELRNYLAQDPDDETVRARWYELRMRRGDFQGAFAEIQERAEKRTITPGEYNQLAWNALFYDQNLGPVLTFAEQGSFLSKNQSYSFLHTLATLYAETGNYKRARDTLFRALNTLEGQQVPDSAWYTLGRIAEGIGLGDASQALYRRVKKPNDPGRYSSWELARRRLKQATTH